MNGIKKVYFGGKNALGNKAPLTGMTSLRDCLTAEAVAWICIGVSLYRVILMLDTVGIGQCLRQE
jgi:hypothetical protein